MKSTPGILFTDPDSPAARECLRKLRLLNDQLASEREGSRLSDTTVDPPAGVPGARSPGPQPPTEASAPEVRLRLVQPQE